MSIRVSCPFCGKANSLPDRAARSRLPCRGCGAEIDVPEGSDPFAPRGGAEADPFAPRGAAGAGAAAVPPAWASGGPAAGAAEPTVSGWRKGAGGVILTLALIGLRVGLRLHRPARNPRPAAGARAPNAIPDLMARRLSLFADPFPGPPPGLLASPGPKVLDRQAAAIEAIVAARGAVAGLLDEVAAADDWGPRRARYEALRDDLAAKERAQAATIAGLPASASPFLADRLGPAVVGAARRQLDAIRRVAALDAAIGDATAADREKVEAELPNLDRFAAQARRLTPCVDLIVVGLRDRRAGEVIGDRLATLVDPGRPPVFETIVTEPRPGLLNFAYRIGPVADPAAFLSVVDLGPVIELGPRHLVATSPRPNEADRAAIAAPRPVADGGPADRPRADPGAGEGDDEETPTGPGPGVADPRAAEYAEAREAIRHPGEGPEFARALKLLARRAPDDRRRAEVAADLARAVDGAPPPTRPELAFALGRWAGPDEAPAMIDLLPTAGDRRGGLIAALDRVHAPGLPSKILPYLGSNPEVAAGILTRLGAPAEELLLDVVDDPEVGRARTAIRVLKDVGGPRSRALIGRRLGHPSLGPDARAAVDAIDARLGAPASAPAGPPPADAPGDAAPPP